MIESIIVHKMKTSFGKYYQYSVNRSTIHRLKKVCIREHKYRAWERAFQTFKFNIPQSH